MPEIILEPWEQRIVSHGTIYNGPPTEAIRVWGARRLLVLARLLPLAERFDVTLLGTGLPSFWVAHMRADGAHTWPLGLDHERLRRAAQPLTCCAAGDTQ